jgi:hypothetical protein
MSGNHDHYTETCGSRLREVMTRAAAGGYWYTARQLSELLGCSINQVHVGLTAIVTGPYKINRRGPKNRYEYQIERIE